MDIKPLVPPAPAPPVRRIEHGEERSRRERNDKDRDAPRRQPDAEGHGIDTYA